jgi:hypothetical protein
MRCAESGGCLPCARHGVTADEIEQAFGNEPLVVLGRGKRNGEERVLCAGMTDAGRHTGR